MHHPVDLRIRLARPTAGQDELLAVQNVLSTGILSNGPMIKQFESGFAALHSAAHAVAVANGTIALQAILMALDIGPGDEVIVPSMSFVSTATCVLHVGAEVRFADIRPDTLNLDVEDVARRITARTKAIIVVHYGGQPADLVALGDLADGAGLHLIEDAAQAHGARLFNHPVGAWGAAGMFSFSPTKNITTGEGGMIVTNDGNLAARVRELRNHGASREYFHESIGYNWRLTELQAAIGVVQMHRLEPIISQKKLNAEVLSAALSEHPRISTPANLSGTEPSFSQYTVLLDGTIDRDAVMKHMIGAGIETKRYYPAIHLMPVFRDHGPYDLPATEDVDQRMISLPFHAGLGPDALQEVARTLRSAVDLEAEG
ncbi:DegT/DnrJ/EryC1/StrS family aminotransferase [Kribbella monticola]|uniref:DegT/DnrJ/EryC1/StrS family aminotransferase n=1 Tax=Kribbella monticola TaxID=2185285 RepID=UPI000DD2DF1F|nr:DegT/DnrJ/EryC1/StrS family aminotransferase [Kribbella monticola]